MFCTNCGKPIEENQKFCVGCGKPLAEIVESSKSQYAINLRPQDSENPEVQLLQSTNQGTPEGEINSEESAEAQDKIASPAPYSDFRSDVKDKKKRWIWLIVILVVVSLAIGTYFVFIGAETGSGTIDAPESQELPASQYQEDQVQSLSEDASQATSLTSPPYYVISVVAVSREDQAKQGVAKLESEGYKAGYLWIPDYASLSGAKFYSVYIGPFATQHECEVAVEDYRRKLPGAYGLLVSHQPERVEIRGIGSIKRTENGTSQPQSVSVESYSTLSREMDERFGIGAGCSYSKQRGGSSVMMTNVAGEALMKINGKFVVLSYVENSDSERYAGNGYEVTLEMKVTGEGHESATLEGTMIVVSSNGAQTRVMIYGDCGA